MSVTVELGNDFYKEIGKVDVPQGGGCIDINITWNNPYFLPGGVGIRCNSYGQERISITVDRYYNVCESPNSVLCYLGDVKNGENKWTACVDKEARDCGIEPSQGY